MKQNSITIVVESMGGGGAQRVIAWLCEVWVKQGVDVCLITLTDGSTDSVPVSCAVKRVHIPVSGVSGNVFQALKLNVSRVLLLRRALREHAKGVVVGFVGTTNVLLILASVGLHFRLVACERNDPKLQKLGILWETLRWMTFRFADAVTANSMQALKTMESYVDKGKLHWVPNPVRNMPTREESSGSDKSFVLAVGRLNHQKGFDILLRAFRVFVDQRPGWKLKILGEGPQRTQLEQLVRDLDLVDCVLMPGFVDPTDEYLSCRFLVQSSRFEGVPNTVLEAMSMGVSVVVTDAQSGLIGYVENNANGLVVPSENSLALAEAMGDLADHPEKSIELGKAAKEKMQIFTEERVIDTWNKALGVGDALCSGDEAFSGR